MADRARWLVSVVVGVLLVAAIVYHGAVRRYSVTHVVGLYVVRFDHLTGKGEACRATRGALSCGAAPAPADTADPYRDLTTRR